MNESYTTLDFCKENKMNTTLPAAAAVAAFPDIEHKFKTGLSLFIMQTKSLYCLDFPLKPKGENLHIS